MKKIFSLFLLLFLCGCNAHKTLQTSNVYATSFIVIEQSSNKILEGYNYNTQRSVASISKIMSAIIVIENMDVNEYLTVPEDIKKVDGSSIYLKVNEKVKVIDLLYGLLLRSGNDAAITLAKGMNNDIQSFVDLMNEKASILSMNNTYFSNPHGLDVNDNGNISTAYDMAILYSYCLKNPLFSKIIATKEYQKYTNKNKLLHNYEYCTGGKTGYTKKAKRTLLSSASKDDMHLIIVTLNCGDDFNSHKLTYEKYFNNYNAIKVLKKGENIFDKDIINIKQDYYFISDKTNLSLMYNVNMKNKEISIKLYDENKKVIDEMLVKY